MLEHVARDDDVECRGWQPPVFEHLGDVADVHGIAPRPRDLGGGGVHFDAGDVASLALQRDGEGAGAAADVEDGGARLDVRQECRPRRAGWRIHGVGAIVGQGGRSVRHYASSDRRLAEKPGDRHGGRAGSLMTLPRGRADRTRDRTRDEGLDHFSRRAVRDDPPLL